jgi:hypothetical protein
MGTPIWFKKFEKITSVLQCIPRYPTMPHTTGPQPVPLALDALKGKKDAFKH